MSSTTANTIIPKPCNYGCNTRIYWNTSENAYWEVFSKKKHICPNRSSKKSSSIPELSSGVTNKPSYYNYSRSSTTIQKPKMANSFELLSGPVSDIQKKYEILSDIVSEVNGKVHGSQRDRDPKTGLIDLLVYYEVTEGKRDEVKQKFSNYTRNIVALQQRN